MDLRFARHHVSVEMGESIDLPMSDFDDDDERIAAMQLVALPFNEGAIQVVTIAHVRSEREQAEYDGQASSFGLSALENLADEEDLD